MDWNRAFQKRAGQRLAANGAEEVEELGRVTKLLQEAIHDFSHGFEEPATHRNYSRARGQEPQAYYDQMKMILHQDITIHFDPVALCAFGEIAQKLPYQ